MMIETDVLIVGAGPAGAALAAFLGQNGVKGIIITKVSGPAHTPRAHYTNPATMQCLRDIDLEYDVKRVGHSPQEIGSIWSEGDTWVGEEFIRSFGFHGSDPRLMGEHWKSSPCSYLDISQTDLEPLLLRYALRHGFEHRWSTEFTSFEDHSGEDYVIVKLHDRVLDHEFHVKTRYLCGADGSRSPVAAQLDLSFHAEPAGVLALNVLYDADLSSFMGNTAGSLLRASVATEYEPPPFGLIGVNRVIRPWHRFLMVMFAAPTLDEMDITEDQIVERTYQFLGVRPKDFKLLDISKWRIKERYARKISHGNIFCLGDAIHQHPPHAGLGSNTCIQDAFNLAWKMAFVLQGKASPSILDSFNTERQPVAKQIVTAVHDFGQDIFAFWGHVGFLEPSGEGRRAAWQRLHDLTAEGRQSRKVMKELHSKMKVIFNPVGVEFNQHYCDSQAICTADEENPRPTFTTNERLTVHQSTYPGFRVPHAWLRQGKEENISTIDLCGKGKFTIFTGPGGREVWMPTIAKLKIDVPNVDINLYSIGLGQDYVDVYWMWEDVREVEEDGLVLVRPDTYIGWRCLTAEGHSADELYKMLSKAMAVILGRA